MSKRAQERKTGDECVLAMTEWVETDFGQSDFDKPTLAKPTLAKPTLANVKVLVVCKDFGFSELIVWVFWN